MIVSLLFKQLPLGPSPSATRSCDQPVIHDYDSSKVIPKHMRDARRKFTQVMKEGCWLKADRVPGRDPDRWRFDAVGNIVSHLLNNCEGSLCFQYDHIIPWANGGPTTVENCQILQTEVNRKKSNKVVDKNELKGYSYNDMFTDEELDVIEKGLYGSVERVANDDALKRGCKVFPGIVENNYTSWN